MLCHCRHEINRRRARGVIEVFKPQNMPRLMCCDGRGQNHIARRVFIKIIIAVGELNIISARQGFAVCIHADIIGIILVIPKRRSPADRYILNRVFINDGYRVYFSVSVFIKIRQIIFHGTVTARDFAATRNSVIHGI